MNHFYFENGTYIDQRWDSPFKPLLGAIVKLPDGRPANVVEDPELMTWRDDEEEEKLGYRVAVRVAVPSSGASAAAE